MKRLIFILALLAGALHAQDGVVISADTLTAAAPSATGSNVYFTGGVRGAAALWGKAFAYTGTDSVITVTAAPIFQKPNGIRVVDDTYETVGTITTSIGDTTVWRFNMSGLSWWLICDGYQAVFTIPGGGGAGTYIEAYDKHD